MKVEIFVEKVLESEDGDHVVAPKLKEGGYFTLHMKPDTSAEIALLDLLAAHVDMRPLSMARNGATTSLHFRLGPTKEIRRRKRRKRRR